jgi:hypothetical protein
MPTCPWYVSAHAVRRYIELTRSSLSFDDASDALIELCARTWAHHQTTGKQPTISRTGAYVYRTPRPERLKLVVSTTPRPEGPKDQVVDVGPAFEGQGGQHQ